jgi:glycosyltransferase involved in cell wall biosynthesis
MADFLYHRASAIVVLTEGNRDLLTRRDVDRSKIHYISNGVDLSAFAGSRRPRQREERVTFVYTGAHGPANGLDIVLQACSLLESRGEDSIDVLLVGDGPSKAELVNAAKSLGLGNVAFRDPLPKSEIPSLLSSADVGLMILAPADLFRFGVSPNKLFDYLAAGLPVLTNVPGTVAEIVEMAEAGRACAPGDATALAEAMAEMAREVRAESDRYRGGRAYVAEHYDRRKLATVLHSVLRSVVDSEPKTERVR